VGKDKIRRFAEIAGFPNVLQLVEGKPMAGKWSRAFFKNTNPLVLELACG
jgi:tRNA (guanine-N7-)-methyltransferase